MLENKQYQEDHQDLDAEVKAEDRKKAHCDAVES